MSRANTALNVPQTATPDPRAVLLDAKSIGRRLGISETQAYRLMWSGDLPSVKIGRSRRVSEAALIAYVEKLTSES